MTVYCGVDFLARLQTVSFMDTSDGELHQQDLHHRKDDIRAFYYRLLQRKERAKARVAVARKVLTRGYIMLRDGIDYAEFLRRGVEARCGPVRCIGLKCLNF